MDKLYKQSILPIFKKHQTFLSEKMNLRSHRGAMETNWLDVRDSQDPINITKDLDHLENLYLWRGLLEKRIALSENRSYLNDLAPLLKKVIELAVSKPREENGREKDHSEVSDHIYEM